MPNNEFYKDTDAWTEVLAGGAVPLSDAFAREVTTYNFDQEQVLSGAEPRIHVTDWERASKCAEWQLLKNPDVKGIDITGLETAKPLSVAFIKALLEHERQEHYVTALRSAGKCIEKGPSSGSLMDGLGFLGDVDTLTTVLTRGVRIHTSRGREYLALTAYAESAGETARLRTDVVDSLKVMGAYGNQANGNRDYTALAEVLEQRWVKEDVAEITKQ